MNFSSCCGTAGFLRAKLGQALAARGAALHLFGNADEAQQQQRDD